MTNYRHAQMINVISKMDSTVLRVRTERCVLVRNRNAECLRCAAACTTGALSVTSEGIVVDASLCIGCGSCASSCPTCCLEALSPTDDDLFARMRLDLQANGGTIAIACSRALETARPDTKNPLDAAWEQDNGARVIPVVCLGRVEEAFLVESIAHGATGITLISADCATCARKAGGALCDTMRQSAQRLLHAMGADCPIERTTVDKTHLRMIADSKHIANDSEQAPTVALSASTDRAEETCDLSFAHVQADGTLPHFVPQRRLRLFNSLKRLGCPVVPAVKTRLWGQVSINTELCRSCRMCTVFCPTGALSRYDAKDGVFGVEHRSTLCVQCRLCETICPEQAITVTDTVSLNEFLSGSKFRFAMNPIGWNPNGADSIPTRMARLIKTDTFQDPQAKMKPSEVYKQRAYALERQRRREELRDDKK